MNIKYQIYGSKSSIDTDMMVFVDKLGTIQENHLLIEKLKIDLKDLYPNKIDVHLAVLTNGMITDVSHGTYDEVNNSLFYTYENHIQKSPNVITATYDRSYGTDFYNIKMIRIARFILSFFSREPELRSEIKIALRGDLNLRITALEKISLWKYTTFPGKKEKHEDIYKVIAFQFAQIFALRNNREIYTKEDAIDFNSAFSKFILREELTEKDLTLLNIYLAYFIKICKDDIKLMNKITED